MTVAGLAAYGFIQSPNVTTAFGNTTIDNFTIINTHKTGGQIITFHADGSFT